MNRSGRVSIGGLLAVVVVAIVAAVFFLSKESLTTVGARFMNALAHGDVDTLTKLSYIGNESPDEIRKQWDYAVNKTGKYYNFSFQITGESQPDKNSGAVRMQVMRDLDNPSSYPENFQLPMIKVGDEWKVDVKGINREMYPGLPR